MFDADDLSVEQHFATSDDAPGAYFVVGHRGRTGPQKTLLGGYGGFENSSLPSYAGVLGRLWL
ncbi:hypothetical protein H7H37_23265, partial [Mycolicibacterium insubricum]|nr:hypothetical protein [Mycolicibacterium insubricum]